MSKTSSCVRVLKVGPLPAESSLLDVMNMVGSAAAAPPLTLWFAVNFKEIATNNLGDSSIEISMSFRLLFYASSFSVVY